MRLWICIKWLKYSLIVARAFGRLTQVDDHSAIITFPINYVFHFC